MSVISFLISLFAIFKVMTLSERVTFLEKDILKLNKNSYFKKDEAVIEDSSRNSMLEVELKEEQESVLKEKISVFKADSHKNTNTETDIEPELFERLFIWLSEDWLVKLGSSIVILGAIFFLSVAFNSFGDIGKITIGYMVGLAVMALGYYYMFRVKDAGSIIFSIGASFVVFTNYAAMFFYDLFPNYICIILTCLVGIAVALVSLRQRIQSLSVLSSMLVFAAPIIFGGENSNPTGLLFYLLVTTMSFLWLVSYTGWRNILLMPIVFTLGYSFLIWINSDIANYSSSDTYLLTGLGFVYALMYSLVNVISTIKVSGVRIIHFFIFILSAALVFGYIYFLLPENLKGFSFLVWAIIFSAISLFSYLQIKFINLFYMYFAGALAFIMIATTYAFDGNVLGIALAVESVIASFIVHLITKDGNKVLLASVTSILGLFYSLLSLFNDSWFDYRETMLMSSFPYSDFSLIIIQSALAIFMGSYMYTYYKKTCEQAELFIAWPIVSVILVTMLQYQIFGWGNLLIISYTVWFSFLAYICTFIFTKLDSLEIVLAFNLLPSILSIFLLFEKTASNFLAVLFQILITSILCVYMNRTFQTKVSNLLLIINSISGAFLIWQFLDFIFLGKSIAVILALVIYAVVGYIVLFLGYNKSDLNVKRVGQTILLLVALRVIFVDAFSYGVNTGVIICILIGSILIATTLITKDKKI